MGAGPINLGNPAGDGVGSFTAAARSHAARIIFQQRPSCVTRIRLYDTNSLRRGALLLILYTKQVGQIYSSAVFLHNPNSMNKSGADGGALQPESLDQSQNPPLLLHRNSCT